MHKIEPFFKQRLQGIAMRLPTQSIRNHVCLARLIVHLQIVILDQFQPSSLPHIQFRLGENILETLVIGVDMENITKQVMSLNF